MDAAPSPAPRRYSAFTLGISLAATWTWPNSIVVTMALMHDQGLAPYVIWAVANCFSIPILGLLVYKWPGFWHAVHTRWYRFVMGFYLWPVTWMNMQGLYEITNRAALMPPDTLQYAVIGLAVAIVVAITVGGFYLSVLTDQIQWGLIMLIMPVAIVLSVLNPGEAAPAFFAGWENIPLWGIWMALVLVTGPPLSAMEIERARHSRSMAPFWIGGAAFTVYMVFAGVAVALSLNIGSILLFSALVLLANMSTMDSAASAHRYLTGSRKWGFVIGLTAALTWPLVTELGILAIWAYAGIIIVPFVLGTLVYAWVNAHKLRPDERYMAPAQEGGEH